MKNCLVLLLTALFLNQQSNLDGMQKKLSFAYDPYAQFRKNVKHEAQEAISTITQWLTFEFIEDMLMLKVGDKERRFNESYDIPSNEMSDDDISDPFLDEKKIDSLSIGQRVVLTCWQKYPYYAARVMQTLRALKPQDASMLSELMCIELFKRLIITHNYGLDIALLIQKYEAEELDEFCERIFNKYNEISCLLRDAVKENLTVVKLLQIVDPDFLRFLFMVRYPYFFEKFIIQSYSHKQDNIIRLFLENGFDPNHQFIYSYPKNSLYGVTLLHAAVADKRVETVLLLLTWNAHPECEDLCGISSWGISCDQMGGKYSQRASKINALLKQCLSQETKTILQTA